jgi:NAD(P)-dependent dehydrogenase (short-subunit alcohol dehydrogenase family)
VKPPATTRFDVTDKVVVITGGSRGLGRAMVEGFAEAGADVVIASRKYEACAELAEAVRTRTGRRALPYACHVGHWDEMPGLVDAVYAEFGRIDVLVNNAGMSPTYDDLTDVTEDLFDKVIDVNLKGPFRLSVLVGTRMVAAGGGSIINVGSSGATVRPRPHVAVYSAAKSGVNAITIALAHAFGPTVRVNCMMVGPFYTDVSRYWDHERMNERLQTHALRRGGQPDEIVGTALYFASEASCYTSGAILSVDGGEF